MESVYKTIVLRNGETAIFRSPQGEHIEEIERYANQLSQEDTYVVMAGEKVTRDEEKRYLEQVLLEIENGNRIHVFVFVNQKLVANADVHRITRFRTRALHVGELAISVAKDYRNLGIGRQLIDFLINEAKKMGYRLLILDVFAENERAIALYQSVGFQLTGERPGGILYKGKYIGQVLMHLSLV